MNTNKIYFIQTENVKTKKRQGWVISSPSQEEAEIMLEQEGWIDPFDTEIISSDLIIQMVDTDEMMDGKTYIKMHN